MAFLEIGYNYKKRLDKNDEEPMWTIKEVAWVAKKKASKISSLIYEMPLYIILNREVEINKVSLKNLYIAHFLNGFFSFLFSLLFKQIIYYRILLIPPIIMFLWLGQTTPHTEGRGMQRHLIRSYLSVVSRSFWTISSKEDDKQ